MYTPITSTDEDRIRRLLRLLLAAFVLSAVMMAPPSPVSATAAVNHPGDWAVTNGVDIAEDGTRFAFDQNGPLLENGYPAYGNAFVTQGYLYPNGTLDDTNGVLSDGSPEFPELVLGTWTCWGFMIGDGAATVDGPWVISTQLFEFENDGVVTDAIVTVGTEAPPGNPAVQRAVTGGTGRFAIAGGQVAQTALGFNTSEGVNLTVDFRLTGTPRAFARPAIVRF